MVSHACAVLNPETSDVGVSSNNVQWVIQGYQVLYICAKIFVQAPQSLLTT